MAGVLAQLKVKDYASWKTVFDSQVEFRKSNGMLSSQVYHDASDPKKVIVVYQWDSVANAQKFTQSPKLKEVMEKAGVEGAPTFTFLNEA